MSSSTVTHNPAHRALWERFSNPELPSPQVVIALLLLFVLFLRLPSALVPREFNVDESQGLSNAMKFLVDPRPWKAVDGGSWGPLNSYFITAFLLMGFKPGYVLVHMLASLLICFQVLIAYLTIRRFGSEKVAAMGGLLFVLFYGLSSRLDYLHYSGELFPTSLLMLGFYLFLMWLEGSQEYSLSKQIWLLFLAGLVTGAAPWCKLQAGPITASLCLFMAAASYSGAGNDNTNSVRMSRLAALIAGAGLTTCLMFVILAQTGAVQDFWTSYIGGNLAYAGKTSFIKNILNCLLIFIMTPLNQLVVVGGGILCLVYGDVRLQICSVRQRWMLTGIAAYALGGIISVARVGFLFRHHAIFLLPPIAYTAAVLSSYLPAISYQPAQCRRQVVKAVFVAIFIAALYGVYVVRYVDMLTSSLKLARDAEGSVTAASAVIYPAHALDAGVLDRCIGPRQWVLPNTDEKIVSVVRGVQRRYPIHSLTVLGWAPGVYVLTGIPPSTRFAVASPPKPGPFQQYYRTRFLEDLQTNPPDLFIDAVAPGPFGWAEWDKNDGYESDPDLRRFIDHNYVLVDQLAFVNSGKPVRLFVLRRL